MNFSNFSDFRQLFRTTCFKERIFMTSSAICFFNLFLLSCKQVSKTIRLLQKFQSVFPRTSKLFIRHHLDHGDIIHDQAYNFAFHQKLESFQYNASLAITVTSRETSRGKLHEELGFESLLTKERSQEVFCEKSALTNFETFTGKHLCQSLFLIKLQVPEPLFNKVACLRTATLLKRDSGKGVY